MMSKYKIIQLLDNVNEMYKRTDNELSSIHFTRDEFNDIYFETKEAVEKAEKYDGIVEAEEKFLATVKGEKKMSKGIEFYLKLVKERDEAYEELSEKQIEYDKLFDEATKIRQERDEANKRIEELEKVLEEFKVNNGVELCDLLNDLKTQNKVLVDGVKAIKENSLLWFEDDNLLVGREFDHEYQLDKYDLNEEDDYNKIKAMLEVVENE